MRGVAVVRAERIEPDGAVMVGTGNQRGVTSFLRENQPTVSAACAESVRFGQWRSGGPEPVLGFAPDTVQPDRAGGRHTRTILRSENSNDENDDTLYAPAGAFGAGRLYE